VRSVDKVFGLNMDFSFLFTGTKIKFDRSKMIETSIKRQL